MALVGTHSQGVGGIVGRHRASDRELPREIWVCHPERMQEVVDNKTGLITGWVYSRGADRVPLQPYEVVFFRYYPGLCGKN